MLYIGEEVGTAGPEVDIALDPLEGTTLTASDMPNALTVIAMAPRGTLLHAPDVYMDKLHRPSVPNYPKDVVSSLTCRPGTGAGAGQGARRQGQRHHRPRAGTPAARGSGGRNPLDRRGDPADHRWRRRRRHPLRRGRLTGIDMRPLWGSGGAPEGVLAASALKCMGGQMGPAVVPQRR